MIPDGSKRRRAPTRSLEQAASTIFVLTALLPLLIFVWILYLLNAMQDTRVQLGLGLSLGISMLGFAILRTTMRRTSEVLRLLVRAEAQGAMRAAAPAVAAPATAVPTTEVDATATGTAHATSQAVDEARVPSPDQRAAPALVPSSSATVAHHARTAHQATASPKVARPFDVAPAIGAIQELRDAADAATRRWQREAEALLGHAVVVSVVNLDEPEYGVLVRVNPTGLVLEQDGQEFGVMWRLVTSVSLDAAVAPVTQPTT